MEAALRTSYLDFVNRGFRDRADGDYIAARALYRLELGPQLLWSAHQAIEKYLKAILLYNDKSTLKLKHNLMKAVDALGLIRDIQFEIPDEVRRFILYLHEQGNNRYFEKYAYTTGRELPNLDQTVWHLRKYCYFMRGSSTPGPDGKRIKLFPLNTSKARNFPKEGTHKFEISGGYLEKILNQKDSDARKNLVWKNFYYGSCRKKKIKLKALSWSAVPAHELCPDLLDILKTRVLLSKELR